MSVPRDHRSTWRAAITADALLHGIAKELGALQVASRLRARFPAEVVRQAASLLDLRRRAHKKFPENLGAFLTRKGLEQATPREVASHRARRVARLVECEGGKILDATCGLGSDSLALAAVGQAVVLADADGLHVLFARANLERAGYAVPAVHTRAEDGAVRAPWLLIDPDRRAEGGERSLDPGRWSPTLDASLALAARARGACIKLAPSFEPSHELEREGLLEWISVRGELCEVCLWTGRLAGEERGRRAVVLGRTGTSVLAGAPEERELSPLDPAAAREVRWISEPDPAVIRAGLVALLARDAHLRPLGPRLAYLGGETPCPPGLAKSWRVVGSAAADVRNVRRLLAEHDVGPIVVKKRGHPDSAETLARRFRGRGSRRGTLIVARLARGHQAYLVEDAPATEGAAPGEEVGDEGFEPPTSSL